jgi:asparagine synthase (glutamine-hydrolysing)
MGGFVGSTSARGPVAQATAEAMLRAEVCRGRPNRTAGNVAVFGDRDVDIAQDDEGATFALWGYAKLSGRAVGASELLLLWRRRGMALLPELSGEHAIAVQIDGETIVARDRYGTRPLYVARTPEGALFATAMGPLLAAGAPATVNRDAVVRSLVLGYVPAPDTALTGIAQLPAGEAWTLAPRERRHRWYAPRERIASRRSIERASSVLDAALDRAVHAALPAGGRVGAFLSGGLDSSLVLARVHEAGREVDAFTLHFGDHLPGELRYARAVTEHLGVRHHVLELDARGFVDGLEPALTYLEDMLSEPIAVPNFLLAREAARSCDVLFTGEGGDPSFGGPKNVGMLLALAYAGRPGAPTLAQAYATAHHHLADDLPVALTREWSRAFDEAGLHRAMHDELGTARRRGAGTTFVGGLMRANVAMKGANNILVKVSKMVGAHELALRSPLFDREVVEVALTIPPWQKLLGTDEKIVLKMAARRSLPAVVVDRPKRGMAVPLRAWLGGALGELARDTLTPRAVRDRGIFRWSYVERLLRLERLPTDLARSRTAEKLWLVLVTELHQRTMSRLACASRRAA